MTNNARPATLAALDLFDLRSAFDLVLTRDEVPMKPDPAGILHAMSTFEADAARTVMVGDSWLDGTAAARVSVPFIGFRPRPGILDERGVPYWAIVEQLGGADPAAERAVAGDRRGRADDRTRTGARPMTAASLTGADHPHASARRWPGCIGFSDWERGRWLEPVTPRPRRPGSSGGRGRCSTWRGRRTARFGSCTSPGTKGKGSTVAYLEAIVRAAGWRTAAYTQPHLHSFRERIRLDGRRLRRRRSRRASIGCGTGRPAGRAHPDAGAPTSSS